jgi:hypothetical protein
MSLVHFFLAFAGLYALLSFAVIPWLERRLRRHLTPRAIRTTAWLALSGAVRSLCLIAALTSGVLIVTLFVLLRVRPGTTPAEVGEAISLLQTWRSRLLGFGPVWGALATALLVVGLVVYSYRSGKRRMTQAFRAVFDRELARLRREAEAGRLQPLPETPEMCVVSAQIEEVERQLREEYHGSIRLVLLTEQLAVLKETYLLLDLQRRMNLRVDPDAVELPRPRNWWERVQTFFISRGLLASLGLGSRLLYVAGTVLLIPCLMGLYSPQVDSHLEAQVVEFQNVRLDMDQAQALKEWQQAERAVAEEERKAEQEQQKERQQAEAQSQQQQQQAETHHVRAVQAAETRIENERRAKSREPEPEQRARAKALEQRHAAELAALEKRHAQEQEALRRRPAAQAREQEAKATAREEDLAKRQAGEAGRDVPGKTAQRGTTSPEQWQEQATAAAREQARSAAKQAAERLRGETESATARFAERTGERVAELNRAEVNRRFEEARDNLGPVGAELSEADRTVLREVARCYERAAAAEWQGVVPERLSSYEVKAQAARDQILRRAAERAPAGPGAPGLEAQPALSRLPGLEPPQRFLLRSAEEAANPDAKLSEVGQRVFTQLEDAARRKPSLVESLKAKLRTFQEPVSRRALSNRLAADALSVLLGTQSPDAGLLIQGLDVEGSRAALERTVDPRVKEALAELLAGGDLESSLEKMARTDPDRPVASPKEQARAKESLRVVLDKVPAAEDTAEVRRAHPPSVSDLPESHTRTKEAGEHLADLSKQWNPDGAAELAHRLSEPLNRYEDLFPGQLGAENQTPRGRMITWLGGLPEDRPPDRPRPGGGGGGFGDGGFDGGGSGSGVRRPPVRPSGGGGATAKASVPAPPRVSASFGRARSFTMLRGFSRVGGVLIGREPDADNAPPLDFRDLRWEEDGDKLRLVLVGPKDEVRRSRPFRKSLVYQALTYAADGRPLTVTMAKAEPLQELRILLHPTLVDTPLGLRAVELDRFVDRYTGGKDFPQRAEATELVFAHLALYRLARAQRALVLLESADFKDAATTFKIPDTALTQLRDEANKELADPLLQKGAALAMKDPKQLEDPKRSPLTVKKEFFDPALVEIILDSAKAGKDMDKFLSEVRQRTDRQILLLGASYRRALEHVRSSYSEATAEARMPALTKAYRELVRPALPAPTFEPWSGVREMAYAARPEVLLPGDGEPLPSPFQFMLQIAFTAPPQFLPARGDNEAAAEEYSDQNPWEFPGLSDAIQRKVQAAVAGDKRSAEIHDDMAEFTVLQRLFRVAFEGKLGKQFPVERLVALTDATAPAKGTPRAVRTPRWNPLLLADLGAEKAEVKRLAELIARLEALREEKEKAEVASGLAALRSCRELLEERGKQVDALVAGWQGLFPERTEKPRNGDPAALKKCRDLMDTWERSQEEWLARWKGKSDLRRFAEKARGGNPDDFDPSQDRPADAKKTLTKAVRTVQTIDLLIQMRYNLGLLVDDRQSLEELIQERPLPPLSR